MLIYGMGSIGKSSLAARIANRMPRHNTVVIYDRYDALAIYDRLLSALPGSKRGEWEKQWRMGIKENGATLGDALEEMLTGPFDEQPILLIIDDLEQILESPSPGQHKTPVKDAPGKADTWRLSLGGVLQAFGSVDTESRLMLTSRYLFSLPAGQEKDLADELASVQLRPMADKERAKQWQAAERTTQRVQESPSDEEQALVDRVFDVAGGNPGLQEILCRPILSGELKVASDALDSVAQWKASGQVPKEESAAQEFFQRVSFKTYRDALTETQYIQLRAATLFSEGLPIPQTVLETVGHASGVGEPGAAIDRLLGLGLVDSWGKIDDVVHLAANPLARPLVENKLSEKEQAYLAAAAITPLKEAWHDSEGDFPYDQRCVEAAVLALMGNAPAAVLEKTSYAAGSFLFYREHNAKAALEILEAARAKIDAEGGQLSPQFLLLASRCAERIGKTKLQISLLEQGLALKSDDEVGIAKIAVTHATATIARDGPEKALNTLNKAAGLFEQAKDVRSRAVTMGKIADILQQRGETDEALRIRREEELPVYERLGDVRERAVTMGKIADILEQRGEIDEALRIRREEGAAGLRAARRRARAGGDHGQDRRHPAGQRGELDEALRIRREEELPVYERLGDVRSRAVTMGKIADILQAARRDRRGAAHPPRGAAAGLRASRRRARAGGDHGPDRRHPAGSAASSTRRCASAARSSCRSTSVWATCASGR